MLFDPSKARIVLASELAKYSIPEEDFLLGPRFLPRGGKCLIGGQTEVGKSWMCLNVIRALVLGEPLFGNPEWPARKCSVLYIESEVGITVPERIRKVFQDKNLDSITNFHCLLRPEGFNLSYSNCCEWLHKEIKEKQFDILVIDPIGDLSSVEENSNSDVNRLMQALKDMQGRAGIIYSHHFGKPPKGEHAKDYDPLDIHNLRGAGKFGDNLDSAILVHRRSGRLVKEWESWTLDARWAKTRHAQSKPGQGIIRFNQLNDGRMLWFNEDLKPITASRPDNPWS